MLLNDRTRQYNLGGGECLKECATSGGVWTAGNDQFLDLDAGFLIG